MDFQQFLECLFLVIALSADAFIASFAYGTNHIRIPFRFLLLINGISSLILAVSFSFGGLIRSYIPPAVTSILCCALLLLLGIVKLREVADASDGSSTYDSPLSSGEAFSLSIALSLDGLAVGVGAALDQTPVLLLLLLSFLCGICALLLGSFLGRHTAEKIPLNLSWFSGIMLIILALLKLRN